LINGDLKLLNKFLNIKNLKIIMFLKPPMPPLVEIIKVHGEPMVKRTSAPVEILKSIDKITFPIKESFISFDEQIEYEIREVHKLPPEINGYMITSPVSYRALSFIEKQQEHQQGFKLPMPSIYGPAVPYSPFF